MKNKLKFVSKITVVAGILSGYTTVFAQQDWQQVGQQDWQQVGQQGGPQIEPQVREQVARKSQELTGDTKLACEAILCLSSGTRPGACGPSLSRYFGISFKRWSDTVSSRKSFLNQCPTSQDSSSANMAEIVDSLANGAGRCDAAYLNEHNKKVVQQKVCPTKNKQGAGHALFKEDWTPPDDSWVRQDDGCYVKPVVVINNEKPALCSAYANSQYTYLLGVKYEGDPTNGGHWVDDSAGGQ